LGESNGITTVKTRFNDPVTFFSSKLAKRKETVKEKAAYTK